LKFFSLKKKLIAWFLLWICLPITIFSSAFLFYESNIVKEEIRHYADKQISSLAAQMDWYFRSVQHISKNYYNDAFINSLVDPGHLRDRLTFLEDQMNLLSMKKVNNYTLEDTVLQVTVITWSGEIYGTNLYRRTFDAEQMRETQWYRQLVKNPWEILWIQDEFLSDLICDDKQSQVFNIWALKSPTTYAPIGFLIVDFSLEDLTRQFDGYFDAQELFAVQDMYGKTLFCSNEARLAEVDAVLHGRAGELEEESVLTSPKYYHVGAETQHGRWSISLFTTQRAALNRYDSFIGFFLLAFTLYISLLVVLLLLVSNQIVHPIQSLTATIRLAQSGNMEARANIPSRDEIGELASAYNGLLDEINRLMDNITAENEQKRRAEMQALSAQINPHFILNTLTSIRALIYQGLNRTAEKAALNFAFLLKNVLSWEKEMCTLSEEMDCVRKCIELYQMSFEYPIRINLEIDPSLYDCMVIKMITQPIVENAVMHGMKPKEGDKSLSIQAIRDDGIKILIYDNGIGSADRFVFNEVNMKFGRGIGMQNVYNRIVLHHGSHYGLQFYSRPGEGTLVTLHLPYIREEGEAHD